MKKNTTPWQKAKSRLWARLNQWTLWVGSQQNRARNLKKPTRARFRRSVEESCLVQNKMGHNANMDVPALPTQPKHKSQHLVGIYEEADHAYSA